MELSSRMVGYYQTETISGAPLMPTATAVAVAATLETMNPVKSLVCSPDLTVFASPAGSTGSAAATASPSSTASHCTAGSTETTTTTTTTSTSAGLLPLRNDEKPYQCLLCQKSFEQKSLYQSHLRSHGKDGEDPYRCNICGKTFAVPARLTRHYRTHTGEKPYQCEYCSKSFSVKENLSVHRRIHTKERPYKCDVCERAFEHSGKLHRHMRIHTGERPHKCTVCAKTFIQSGQLVIHMRTHTGEKPYVCKACDKGFTCSKQLKVHTRTHTGEKPYTCNICGKAFGYNHVLKLHQVAHYGEKVYKCTLCHETFGSKKTMELHIKTHSDSSSSSSSSGEVSPRDSPIEPMIEISQEHGQGLPVQGPAGSGSDKENDKTDERQGYATPRDFYYVYPRDPGQQELQGSAFDERTSFQPAASTVPLQPVEQTHVFLYPEMVPVPAGYSPTFAGLQSCEDLQDGDCSSLMLNLPGNDARRRVEAALEAVEEERQRENAEGVARNRLPARIDKETMLTPPSSNPVSPAPSFSPDPLDLAVPARETLILPPRKRCKMILESMESERSSLLASQRQSSVIQFARAS